MDPTRYSLLPAPGALPIWAADPPRLALAPPLPREDLQAAARQLLVRIGWDEGRRVQEAVYARMPAARKMQLALRWRAQQLETLRRQLEREHPAAAPAEVQARLLERLAWAREPRY